jgi:hypothetical protein
LFSIPSRDIPSQGVSRDGCAPSLLDQLFFTHIFGWTRGLISAPKGRSNEAQAEGLGPRAHPVLPQALKGRDRPAQACQEHHFRGVTTAFIPPLKGSGLKRPRFPRPLAWAVLGRPFGALNLTAPPVSSQRSRRCSPGSGRELAGTPGSCTNCRFSASNWVLLSTKCRSIRVQLPKMSAFSSDILSCDPLFSYTSWDRPSFLTSFRVSPPWRARMNGFASRHNRRRLVSSILCHQSSSCSGGWPRGCGRRVRVPGTCCGGTVRSVAEPLEAVKKSRNKQKHLAQRRKGAEAEKIIKDFFRLTLSVSAPLREFIAFFTAP